MVYSNLSAGLIWQCGIFHTLQWILIIIHCYTCRSIRHLQEASATDGKGKEESRNLNDCCVDADSLKQKHRYCAEPERTEPCQMSCKICSFLNPVLCYMFVYAAMRQNECRYLKKTISQFPKFIQYTIVLHSATTSNQHIQHTTVFNSLFFFSIALPVYLCVLWSFWIAQNNVLDATSNKPIVIELPLT